MDWIALSPSLEHERTAWGWRALQFTPRVAEVGNALLLEVSSSLRLFGGPRRLLQQLLEDPAPLSGAQQAWASTSLVALGLLRLKCRNVSRPRELPDGLPLAVLDAAVGHLPMLERAGLRTWGDLRALPRGGVARRFGAALVDALDAAWGDRPERYPWLALPEVFDQGTELPELATTAPGLMAAAQHLLGWLQVWLQARHRGVLALELEWALDLKRLDGVRLPSHERLVVRTAQPVQHMHHLRRLLAERLERTPLAAPANHLRLRTLETVPWAPADASFLPEDNVPGERLHELVERLTARLGAANVQVPLPQADWRPEHMQCWVPAVERVAPVPFTPRGSDALYPPWLLPRPLRLEVRGERPWHGDAPLRLLTRRQRVETGWWEPEGAVVRDGFIARSETAGLLWIYCEHTVRPGEDGWPRRHARWFLQGVYA